MISKLASQDIGSEIDSHWVPIHLVLYQSYA